MAGSLKKKKKKQKKNNRPGDKIFADNKRTKKQWPFIFIFVFLGRHKVVLITQPTRKSETNKDEDTRAEGVS
jgi:hypothetical protein